MFETEGLSPLPRLLTAVMLAVVSVAAAEDSAQSSPRPTEQSRAYAKWLTYSRHLRGDPCLILYYSFDQEEGASAVNQALGLDVGGYRPEDLNGAIRNAAWTEGRWRGKKALRFGGDGHVELTSTPILQTAYKSRGTMEMWVRIDSDWNDRQNHYLFDPSGYPEWTLYKSSNGDALNFFVGTTATGPPAAWRWQAHKWYHVAVTWDNVASEEANGVLLAYVNGKAYPHYSTKKTIKSPTLRSHTRIAGGHASRSPGLDGILGEVAVYDRVLGEDEIEHHYRMGRPTAR